MKLEFSAGGVVFKKEKGDIAILLTKHSQNKSWGFPKGLIGDKDIKESKEQTAVREVKEEAGVNAVILKQLDETNYWYQWQGEKIKKTVYYFLMECIDFDFSRRDNEMEEVIWCPVEEVESTLTFSADKKLWKEAEKELQFITGF